MIKVLIKPCSVRNYDSRIIYNNEYAAKAYGLTNIRRRDCQSLSFIPRPSSYCLSLALCLHWYTTLSNRHATRTHSNTSKDVATPCADMYATVRLAMVTRPLHCTSAWSASRDVSKRWRDMRNFLEVFDVWLWWPWPNPATHALGNDHANWAFLGLFIFVLKAKWHKHTDRQTDGQQQ